MYACVCVVAGRSCRWRGISACRLHPLLLAGAAAGEASPHAACIHCCWQELPLATHQRMPLASFVAGRACRWFLARKVCNWMWKSMHGNIHIVVANVGALSNVQLAVRSKPEVALLQELWASSEEIRSEAKRLG